jgi:hypothetical protein
MAAVAQQPGGVRGVVSDNSGAVIPSASIQLTGPGGSKSTVAQNDGSYTFGGLAAGQYTVRVTYPGFVPFERTIAVEDGHTLQLPVQLVVGAEKQSVTVQSDAGPTIGVEPDQNASALVVKGSDLDALPDDPDDLQDMLNTLAGPAAGPGGGQIYVDGFSGGQLPPKATIREIRINQNPLSAEYDRLGFGRIEILTKPGSDKLRGSFGLNDSDAYFNSRNPYATNKADYVNRFINANLSGPLGHRASFFLNFFDQVINTDALINAVTLDSSLHPRAVQNTVVTPRHRYNYNPRVDLQLSKNNTLTVRLQGLTGSSENQGIGQYSLVARAYNADNSYQDLQASLTSILTPTVVNDLRFEFVRSVNHNYGDNTVAAINVAASFSGGGAQVGRTSVLTHHYELQNNTSMGRGRHTYRFGVRIRRDSLADSSPTNFGGTFTFFGAAGAPVLDANEQVVTDPATSAPETTSISSLEQYRRTLVFQQMGYSPAQIRAFGGGASQFSIAAGNPLAAVGQNDLSFFVQDDWRVKPNLTVSTGLRYETQSNLHDWRDFAPRIGIAWGPGGKANKPPKLVLRGGVGMFYDRVSDNLRLQQLRFNGLTQQQYVVTNPDFFPNVPSVASLAAEKQPPVTYQLDKTLRAPETLMGAISVEKQLPWRTSLAATYIGFHGMHLVRTVDINSPLPGTYNPADPTSGLRPYGNAAGNIFQYESDGISNFNEFITTVNTQFTKKVSLNVAYGRIKVSSDVDSMGMPSDPYNFKADYGRSNLERKNIAQVMGSILAPFKIRMNPFLVVFGGTPYDLTIGRDLNGDTITNDRPAFATDLARPSVVFTRFGAFDTNPLPGQRIVPRDYLVGNAMWNVNCRIGRTFAFGTVKRGSQGVAANDQGIQAFSASMAGGQRQQSGGEKRFSLNLSLFVNNVFNHLNRGGWVGNLSSPLFGQSTAIYLQRETSNDRLLQFGTQLSF